MRQKPKIFANDLLASNYYIPPRIPIDALKPIGISLSRFSNNQGIVAIELWITDNYLLQLFWAISQTIALTIKDKFLNYSCYPIYLCLWKIFTKV